MTERWLPVVGGEGLYEVSDLGRVRSIDRVVVRGDGVAQRHRGMILKPTYRGPYQRVFLNIGLEKTSRTVHVLVLESFVGPKPGLKALHCNGIHDDNRLENLRWGTQSDNMYDQVRHGAHFNASKTHCKRGHEFTPENTRMFTQGKYVGRQCIACESERQRRTTLIRRSQRIVPTVICRVCGSEFSSSHPRAAYCSADCHRESNRICAAQYRARGKTIAGASA